MKINWYGSFGSGQGYSGAAENMVRALERKGVDVRIIADSDTDESTLSEEFKDIRNKPFALADIGIYYGFPAGFDSMMNNKYKIGFTMFETDRLPNGKNKGRNDWAGKDGNAVKIINELDELWVPCEWNKEIFKKNGVKIPIKVIHHGVDSTEYKYIERNHKDKPFTFLMLGTLTARKNPGAVLSAFIKLFGDNPNAQVIFKTQSGTMGHLTLPNNNIKIIDKLMPREEVMKLFEQADCFLFPTRGEGFGLPPLEAMATGLPTILADHSGMADFCDDRYNYPIRKNKVTPAFRYPKNWGKVGNWFEPDYEELKDLMLYVFDNQEEARTKGKEASDWVLKNWTMDNTADSIISELEKVEQKIK